MPLLAISILSFGQSKSPFLFTEFVKGTVLQKGGGVVGASLNYNTITQEMMFEQEGKKLVLDKADNIDTIYVQNRKFVLARQLFLEKLTSTPVSLYVQNKGTAVNGNASIGAGGDNNNTVAGFIGSKPTKESVKIDPYTMQVPNGYSIRLQNIYWLEKNGQFTQATDLKKC